MEEGRLSLKVEGMTCNHCASTVSGIIQQEGGADIHVDYLMGEANFNLNNSERLAKIIKRLESAGYPTVNADEINTSATGWNTIEKRFAFTLPFSLILFSHMFVPHDWWINNAWVQLALCLPVFATGVLHFGKSTFESIKSGNINMDLLILLGSTSAFFYSLYGAIVHGGTPEAHQFLFFETTSTIITLVLLGYVIEHRAVQKTTTILKDLFKSKPEKAKKLVQNGLNQDLEVVPSSSLQADDIILVNTGDRIPADGVLIHADLSLDESMLTGEADIMVRSKGDSVLSGSVVSDGNGTIKVTQAGNQSTIGQIIDLVKASRSDKPSVQKLADRISSWFVPTIVALASLAFLMNYFLLDAGATESLLRSIAVLVIACPCAMGLATPTAVSVGLGLAAKLGIIVKRASAFEEISSLNTIVFDKTGTLTTGDLNIVLDQVQEGFSMEQVWGMIRALEIRSNHPIANQLLQLTEGVSELPLEQIEEVKGKGMSGQWNGKTILFGTPEFTEQSPGVGDLCLVVDGQLAASLHVKDHLKEDANQVTRFLRSTGKTLMILSGDRKEKTEQTAQELGISEFKYRQLPEDKLRVISELKEKGKVGMIGDGINDSPSLAKADVGISIGNANALAAESAKAVILGEKMINLQRLFKISDRVVSTIKQNLFWAFAYNLVAIPLAALGYLDPMLAALSMAFSDVVVIGNSLRLRLVLGKQTT